MDTGLLFLALLLREVSVSVSETQGTLATPPAYSTLPAASLSNISTDPGSTTAGISGSTTRTDFLTTPTPDHTATAITTTRTTTTPDHTSTAITTTLTTPTPDQTTTAITSTLTTPTPGYTTFAITTILTTPTPDLRITPTPDHSTNAITTNLTIPTPDHTITPTPDHTATSITTTLTTPTPDHTTTAITTTLTTPTLDHTTTAITTTLTTPTPDHTTTAITTTLTTPTPDHTTFAITTILTTPTPGTRTTTVTTTLTIPIPSNQTTTIPTSQTTTVPTNQTTTVPTNQTTTIPTNQTTTIPTNQTTTVPTNLTTPIPTNQTTTVPTNLTTTVPTKLTTSIPTNQTTTIPTNQTTTIPTNLTTPIPTNQTTTVPTNLTTTVPTKLTTSIPTNQTTTIPTNQTTTIPTNLTTPIPTNQTTTVPTNLTTPIPTSQTTTAPTNLTTTIPTDLTTSIPTDLTTSIPTNLTTPIPTNQITTIPTNQTTPIPTIQATTVPTTRPTTKPGTLTTTQPGSLTPSNPAGTSTTVKQTTTTKHTPNSTLIPGNPTTPAPPASPTSPSFPSTRPPLVCIHGQNVNGVCLCPDEWTGKFCQIPNFCKGTVVDVFTFNKTVIGRFSYSREQCPGPANVGFPLASVQCLNKSGSPGFGPVRKLDCNLTLNDLQKNITGNSVSVSTNVLMLTSQPTRLTPDNITTAANIVTQLLNSTPTEEVAVAAVATVSQLLSANIPDVGTVSSSATNSLTSELASFSLQQKKGVSLLVQPNLVVQSVGGLGASRGVEFLAQTGLSDQFVADRIHLNKSTSQLSNDHTSALSVQIFLQLQPGASRKDESVGFVLYQNDLLFRSVKFKAPLGTTRRVISASLTNGGRLGLVELRFRPTNAPGAVLHDFACVFWNYAANDWSTTGCKKNGSSSTSLGCVCDHTTNFAVLMSFRKNYAYAEALNWISILGCSLSVAGASVTIIFQILTRRSRKANVTLLLVSICFSLLVFYLLFLFGINNDPPVAKEPNEEPNVALPSDEHEERDSGGCTAIAALLHYFLLATFAWNTLYATQIFLLVLRPLAQNGRPFTIAALVAGWGFPAAVVAVTLGATYTPQHPLNYRQEEFCWLAALDKEKRLDLRKPMLWGFLLPVALMLLYNCVIYVYFTVETCRTDPKLRSTRIHSPVKKVLSSLSLSVVLGLSWVLGYLLLIDTASSNNVVGIIFCVLTTTQGLQIFFLFTARTSAFKKKLSELLQFVPVPEIALHHRKFVLWEVSRDSNCESYRTMEDLSSSQF